MRITLICATLALVFTLLMPPWVAESRTRTGHLVSVERSGPRWLFAPPALEGTARVDFERLLLEWLAIATVAGAAALLMRKPARAA